MNDKAHSVGVVVISIVVAVGFFGVLALLMVVPASAAYKDVVEILVGVLGQSFAGIVHWWTGSSFGSKAKDATIASLATTQTGGVHIEKADIGEAVVDSAN